MSKKAIIVISSHVARGSVGNRAAVFALETLGFPVWAIPTITLPWHPGHGPSTRIIPSNEEFSSFLQDITNSPWIDEVSGILSGYMANAAQAQEVAKLVKNLKIRNPNLVYLCDPVIGDEGGLYIAQETAQSIRDELVNLADITTPNCFELAWLTGKNIAENVNQAISMANQLAPKSVITTSSPSPIPGETGNLYCGFGKTILASHSLFNSPPNGPGDLTAALYLGHLLANIGTAVNLLQTTSSVYEILENATKKGSNELTLESDAQSIVNPKARIRLIDFS